MSNKPLLDGSKAKFIFSELSDMATQVVNSSADALLAQHSGKEEALTEAIANILRHGMTVQRVACLLEAGHADEAEALIMRGNVRD